MDAFLKSLIDMERVKKVIAVMSAEVVSHDFTTTHNVVTNPTESPKGIPSKKKKSNTREASKKIKGKTIQEFEEPLKENCEKKTKSTSKISSP